MFLSPDQIRQSLKGLSDLHPFFGISLLAFKRAGIPIGKTRRVVFSQMADDVLERHYKPVPSYSGFYHPFKTSDRSQPWLAARYGSTSLQRITTDTFGDALIHTKGSSEWGWQADYLRRLQGHLGPSRIPAFDLSVWLFRLEEWPNSATLRSVRDRLFEEYQFGKAEVAALFDTTLPPPARPWHSDRPISEGELVEEIGPPPGSAPAEGAALSSLHLEHVGPAKQINYEPSDRLNIMTGDNSLGKTFILECIWWALTGASADDWLGYPALPRRGVGKRRPKISFSVSTATGKQICSSASYAWDRQEWTAKSRRAALPGLVIYGRHDGSFAMWDPARDVGPDRNPQQGPAEHLFFRREEIWNGLWTQGTSGSPRSVCNGLIQDWVLWQTAGERYQALYAALTACLDALSPEGVESLVPSQPTRLPSDAREFPTIRMPYGDVAVVHASAGVQRIVALAYLMVWAWREHTANSELMQRKPQRRLVLLIDEIESHLHPRWQRVIVPALVRVVRLLAPAVSPQLHVVTHSPMILASAETVFDERIDRLHHLRLNERNEVVLEELSFSKRGRADVWLVSEVFGLAQARSLSGEQAIEDAKSLQRSQNPIPQRVEEVNRRLVRYLAQDDDFWPRWRFFAEQHGLNE